MEHIDHTLSAQSITADGWFDPSRDRPFCFVSFLFVAAVGGKHYTIFIRATITTIISILTPHVLQSFVEECEYFRNASVGSPDRKRTHAPQR